jgi:ABC-type sugar transport system ATPase subunit
MTTDRLEGREAASASLLLLRGISKSFGPVEALKALISNSTAVSFWG